MEKSDRSTAPTTRTPSAEVNGSQEKDKQLHSTMDKPDPSAAQTASTGDESEIRSPFFLVDGQPSAPGLPPLFNHFNAHDLKQLFKSSIAVWVAFLLIVIEPSLRVFGQATFLACIILFILPASGILLIQVLAATTLIVGTLLAWAWGSVAAKAALSTRPASETAALYKELTENYNTYVQNAGQASGQSQWTQLQIYNGFMLDPRISITYVGMGCIFIFFMYRLRAAVPKFTLMALFGCIVINIYLCIAVLIPTFQGTIAKLLVLPIAAAVGIGLACNIIFFPESTSSVALRGMSNVLKPMKPFLDAILISFEHPEAPFDAQKLGMTKVAVLMGYKSVDASLGFLPLDVTYGRWNSEDVGSLRDSMRQVITMFVGLISLQGNRLEAKTRGQHMDQLDKELKQDRSSDSDSDGSSVKKPSSTIGARQLTLALDVRHKWHHPDVDQLLWESLGVLFSTSGNILGSCGEGLDAIMEAFDVVNYQRWFRKPSKARCEELAAKHEEVLERLREQHKEFAQNATQKLLDPHTHLFSQDGKLLQPQDPDQAAPIHGLVVGMMYEERILGFSAAVTSLLTRVIELEKARTKSRIWPPTGLRHFFSWVFGAQATPGVASGGDTIEQTIDRADPSTVVQQDEKAKKSRKQKKQKSETQEQLETLRFQGGRKRGPVSRITLAIVNWLTSEESLFGFRAVIVTIVIATVANCKSTAGFFYREKGLWAIIMAQMALTQYTADFVYGFAMRVGGTIVGCLLGLAVWYIGAGNGPGNPYGMAAIMGVVILPLMWLRLFAPPQWLQGSMLLAASCFLTVGYSWVDTHIPSYGNPGVGYNVFWRRLVLVLAGMGVAAIVMFFPRPPSASRHYRRVLGGVIRSEKDLYALFAATWRRSHNETLTKTAEIELINDAEQLGAMMGPLKMLKLEFSSSNFDSDTLVKINRLCSTIASSLMQLFHFSSHLTPALRSRFERLSGAFTDNTIGDIMAVLTLIEQSLKSGDPLPAMLPVPLVARALTLQAQIRRLDRGEDAITREMILQEEFRKYCVVLGSYVQLLSACDEMVIAVKQVCGETHVVDIENWPLMETDD